MAARPPLVRLQGARRGLDPRPRRASTLRADPPRCRSALVEARYPGGTHDVYQLLLGVGADGFDDAVIDDVGGVTVYDAFADPRACELLGGLLRDGAEVHGEHARVEFHWLEGVEPPRPAPTCARSAPSSPTPRSSSTTSWC